MDSNGNRSSRGENQWVPWTPQMVVVGSGNSLPKTTKHSGKLGIIEVICLGHGVGPIFFDANTGLIEAVLEKQQPEQPQLLPSSCVVPTFFGQHLQTYLFSAYYFQVYVHPGILIEPRPWKSNRQTHFV